MCFPLRGTRPSWDSKEYRGTAIRNRLQTILGKPFDTERGGGGWAGPEDLIPSKPKTYYFQPKCF